MKQHAYKRRSKIWLLTKTDLQQLCDESDSLTQVLVKLGFCHKGNNHVTLHKKLVEENISLDKLNSNRHLVYSRRKSQDKIPLNEILVVGSNYSRRDLKKRLISDGLIENRCHDCGLLPIWNDKPLSLQLDHKNGINNDNRLNNLRLLCPNCHTQTDTFGGKANKKPPKLKNSYDKHQPNLKLRRVERPSREELNKLLWEKPTLRIAKDFGVSDKAVSKWAKSYGIEKPPRGYWGFKKS